MDIDDFIIADTSSRWRKVAMVIGSALLNPEIQIPEGKDKAQLVATRIETMVRDGKLEVEGSLKDWRYSEVRHAQSS